MEGKFYVTVGISKKSGNRYVAFGVDLGYTKKNLTFDYSLIAEMLGMSVREFTVMTDNMRAGDYKYIEPSVD